MDLRQVVYKVGGRKFALTLVGGSVTAYLASKGVPPEASAAVLSVVLGGIAGIAIEDVAKAFAAAKKNIAD